jgi:hypothetical protein
MQKGKKLNPLTILFPVAIAAFGVYYIIKKSKTPKPQTTDFKKSKTPKPQTTDFYAKKTDVKVTNVKDTPKVESKTYLGELGDKLNNFLSFLKP